MCLLYLLVLVKPPPPAGRTWGASARLSKEHAIHQQSSTARAVQHLHDPNLNTRNVTRMLTHVPDTIAHHRTTQHHIMA